MSLRWALVLGCALATLGCAARSHEIGLEQVEAGDYQRAVAAFRDAASREPDSALHHYNLGFALGAAASAAAAQDSTTGQLSRLSEADHHLSIAESLDPAQFAPLVESARAFRFGELYNQAVERSGRGEMATARQLLGLARATSDAPSHRNRTRVLDLQIALSETLQLDAPDRSSRTMKILYELESLKDAGAGDDALLDEIENTLARARSLLTDP